MGNLDGLNYYADFSLEDTILTNVIDFLKYGFLEIGAFINVTSGVLSPVVGESGVQDYSIYRGVKDDWVWESNISLKYSGGSQPYIPSGIFVNDTFYPTGTTINGTGYYFDFVRGRVVFDGSMPPSTNVQANYAVRYVHIYDNEDDKFRQLERNWIGVTGNANDFALKAYLPCFAIGLDSYKTIKGYTLGSRSKDTEGIIRFDIFADNPSNRKRITDLVYMLENKSFKLYDLNLVPRPLDYKGQLISGMLDWKNLSENYSTGSVARFTDKAKVIRINDTQQDNFRSRVLLGLDLVISV